MSKMNNRYRDRHGNPIMLPDWYEGSLHSFADIVNNLKEHHCSFPSGSIKAIDRPMPCMVRKQPGQMFCKDHMAHSVSMIHTEGMDSVELARMAGSIGSSALLDTNVNVFYADRALARAAKRCRDGGLNEKLAKSLDLAADAAAQMSKRCKELWADMADLRRDLSNEDLEKKWPRIRERLNEKQQQWQNAYEELLESHTRFRRIASISKKDEANWAELTHYNDHSIKTKENAVRIMHARQGFLAIEESRAALLELAEAVEDILAETIGDKGKEEIMERVYVKLSSQQAPQPPTIEGNTL